MKERNLDTYNDAKVLSWYNELETLVGAEQRVFEKYSAELASGSVLDIGIGGGRTTAYLLDASGRYTGIDYSEGFVTAARQKFPGADLRLSDARNLEAFNNGQFDFVNFSFNGMDYVEAEGRKQILAEVWRVLKPGGTFFFSTHNKAHAGFNTAPWMDSSLSPLTRLKTFIKLLPFLVRHRAQKRHEYFSEPYAIINDSAHNYGLLTFYTTPAFLKEQLQEQGFGSLCFLSKSGKETAGHLLDDWIFVVCKKSAV